MRYVSTRGQAPVRDFSGVLLAGLAEDGGLYVPETWPTISPDQLRALRGLPYPELAARVLGLFTYGLHEYKQGPDWLNAKFWANPQNVGKYWW